MKTAVRNLSNITKFNKIPTKSRQRAFRNLYKLLMNKKSPGIKVSMRNNVEMTSKYIF